MYRLILESLLGLRLELDRLYIKPCLPVHWDAFRIHYRYRETVYHLAITQTVAGEEGKSDVTSVIIDGVEQGGQAIPLVDDHREHTVSVSVLAL
jgi:cellobiose phosphorylase